MNAKCVLRADVIADFEEKITRMGDAESGLKLNIFLLLKHKSTTNATNKSI